MSKRRKKSQFGKKKGLPIYQNNPRSKDKDSSGDRKGVIQSVKGALGGRKSEAPDTPAAASIAPTKSDFDVDKMLKSQGITIPRSIMGDAAPPAAKPTATPAAKPTATPAPTPTATPASPSGGQVKGVTAEGMMQEMGFDLPTPVAKNDEEYKQRFYDFLDQTPKEKLKFPDPKPQDPTKDVFDEAFRKSTPPTPSPSTPAAAPSDRGLIDGIPTAKRLSEVKSRVDVIRGAADKAPTSQSEKPKTPTGYQKPKNVAELRDRQRAAAVMEDAYSRMKSLDDKGLLSYKPEEELRQAMQDAKDLGIPEAKVKSYLDRLVSKKELQDRQAAAAELKRSAGLILKKDQKKSRAEGIEMARKAGLSKDEIDSFIEREIEGPKREKERNIKDLEVKLANDPKNSEKYFEAMLKVVGVKPPSKLSRTRPTASEKSILNQLAGDVNSGRKSIAQANKEYTEKMDRIFAYEKPYEHAYREYKLSQINAKRGARGLTPIGKPLLNIGSPGNVGKNKGGGGGSYGGRTSYVAGGGGAF